MHAPIEALFGSAAAMGRTTLDWHETAQLLAAVGVATPAEPGASEPGRLGRELRIELHNSREFGPVIKAGLGGLEATLGDDGFRKDRAAVAAATELADGDDLLELFRRTHAYRRLAALEAHAGQATPDRVLHALFTTLIELANRFSPANPDAALVIDTLVLDPLVIEDASATAVAAECRIGRQVERPVARPVGKIDRLLHPESIGIIGVSASKMNFGRIILNNIIDSGFDRTRMTVIRPGESEIDGVKCAESLAALDHKLDLFIVAVAADAVYDLVDEIIATDAAETVMLIPGSLGETRKSKEPAAALAARINRAHLRDGGGPIFLGANCLGVVSHPGRYDSWFIPLERLPKPPKKPERNSALLSQSGAFMITRLSRNPWLDPRYMIASGNQTDLTHGDLLSYFAELPEIETIGLYIEGFRDYDGLQFAQAVRRAVLNGKQVVIYKSGRTASGAKGVMGHTASIAGDPRLFESVLRQAGAIVTTELTEFDDLFYIAGALHGKRIDGNRLGAISGAGFEAVGMADSTVTDTFAMEMGALEPDTVAKVEAVLAAKRLDALVEVRNPIDINPGADDEAHLQCTEAFINDPNIDAVIVGLDPTAPSVRALEQSTKRPGYDLSDPNSTVTLMPELVDRIDQPIIGVVDGGPLYDTFAARLMDRGVCTFRTCSRAALALTRYVESRLQSEALRRKQGRR